MIQTFYPSERHFEDACAEFLTELIKDPSEEAARGIYSKLLFTYKNYTLIRAYVFRQTVLGKYGKLDLAVMSVFESENGERIKVVNIFELKNVEVTIHDVEQVSRYRYAFLINGTMNVYCHLIGPSVKIEDYSLFLLYEYVKFYTYTITFGGGRFIRYRPKIEKPPFDLNAALEDSIVSSHSYGGAVLDVHVESKSEEQ
jgi:hypothetical protein